MDDVDRQLSKIFRIICEKACHRVQVRIGPDTGLSFRHDGGEHRPDPADRDASLGKDADRPFLSRGGDKYSIWCFENHAGERPGVYGPGKGPG
jgi:hypothetical protein